ncbi:winged helix-turn-helix domain-containing protein [Undibacterium sp. TJN19]|uniref:winged helix-turn-helix domain-containing protein n=1 Tax=Undibacterium sp. TJN19 TaxID=3413055 RepID=UPI003BF31301
MSEPEFHLSLNSARALHLAAQGLLNAPQRKTSKQDVLDCIKNMSALQIDTISVVARSPYLVLWSRLGHYPQAWLNELLAEGQLFEYWSHEACFLPIEDYGLYRHQMVSPQGLGWKYNHKWLKENAAQVDKVRQHIHENGASRSADFERTDGKSSGWWEWKPEKRSLEVLFTTGELMVARRHNFQRIYDLRERVHPKWDDKKHLQNPLACQRTQILQSVRALGVTKASWIADYFRMGKPDTSYQATHLAKEGLLIPVSVQNHEQVFYVHPDRLDLLQQANDNQLKATATRILSPFDPIVWDRKRAIELFDFDYKLECYTPEAKRRYGYFTLPILRKGALIGRMDAKAHRKDKLFEIKALHLEPGQRISQAMASDLAKTLREFANWHECTDIKLSYTNSSELSGLLQAQI